MNDDLVRFKNTNKSITFGSACHGAGRVMSRSRAPRLFTGKEVMAALKLQGIVGDVVHNLKIAPKVAKVVPLGVSKG